MNEFPWCIVGAFIIAAPVIGVFLALANEDKENKK